jgi:hypothetical protein
VFIPPFFECVSFFRPDGDNFSITANKLLIITAQLRHMVTAVGSLETAIEHQHHILLAFMF